MTGVTVVEMLKMNSIKVLKFRNVLTMFYFFCTKFILKVAIAKSGGISADSCH